MNSEEILAKARYSISRMNSPGVWTLYDQVVVSGCNFISNVLIARHLGVVQYGKFALLLLCILMLNNFHRALMTQPLNVLGAIESPYELRNRMGALLVLQIAAVSVSAIALTAFSAFFVYDYKITLCAVLLVLMWQYHELVRRYLYTVNKFRTVFLVDVLSYGGGLVGVVVAHFSQKFEGWIFLLILASGYAAGLLSVSFLRNQKIFEWPDRLAIINVFAQHWKFGRWLALSVVAIWVANQSYPFILQFYGGSAAVGIYMASRNLLNGTSVFVQAANSYLPGKAKAVLHNQNKDALLKYLKSSSWLIGGAALTFCSFIAIFPEPIITFVFGGEFVGSSNVLRVLAVGTWFATASITSTAALTALERTRSIFISQALAAMVTLIIGAPLVKYYGAVGAAAGFTAGFIVVYLYQEIEFRRK